MASLFPANNLVPAKLGSGDILVVGEAPGETEAVVGEPLVGASGRLFDSMCSKAGLRRDELSLANVLCCRPPDNKFPTDSKSRDYISEEDAARVVEHCTRAYLDPVLRGHKWSKIIPMGGKALEAVCGTSEVTRWRGSIIPSKVDGIPAVPTLHPSYLMQKAQDYIPVTISDLKKSTQQPSEQGFNLHPSLYDVEEFCKTTVEFCIDIETNPYTQEVLMVGLSRDQHNVLVVPFMGAYIQQLANLFATAEVVIGHNLIQADIPWLAKAGIKTSPDCFFYDTMLMHHLVQPDLPHDLEFVASVFTNRSAWKAKMDEDKELYCARDVAATFEIYEQLLPILKWQKLLDIYTYISQPLGKICYLLHEQGMKTDPAQVRAVREGYQDERRELERILPESLRTHDVSVRHREKAPAGALGKSGKPVKYVLVPGTECVTPWRSDKSVGDWLYNQLKLPVQTKGDDNRVTTDKNALDRLFRISGYNPAIKAVRELRRIDEILTTFAKEDLARLGTTIHANFNVHGTSTGRLSSSEPNMQNWPEPARAICIPHRPGWKFVSIDFSSIENRLTALFAGDTERLERYNQPGFNEHKYATSVFFGIPYEQVEKSNATDAPYKKAKCIVHGVDGGEGARKIATLNDLPEKEVKVLLGKWKQVIPKTFAYQERVGNEAKTEGVLCNPFCRKRWFVTTKAYTEGVRTPAQSTAAEIILRCMIALYYERIGWPVEYVYKVVQEVRPLPQPNLMCLQVHDQLLFAGPEVAPILDAALPVMTQRWPELGNWSCPVAVEVGDDWCNMEPYKV
jgi:uracil-DNA glycosylase family 4